MYNIYMYITTESLLTTKTVLEISLDQLGNVFKSKSLEDCFRSYNCI